MNSQTIVMVKLCSMASHVLPPGLAIVVHQDQKRVIKIVIHAW